MSAYDPKRKSQVKNDFRVQLSIGSLWADPAARRQSRQFGRQSVEHALDEAVAQRASLFIRPNKSIDQQESQSMHEGPARQNGAGNLLFVTGRGRNGASQSARRYNAREKPLSLLGFGQFDRGAAMIRT